MGAIFISHSSRDNVVAVEIAEWLRGAGHTSLFLDLDKDDGLVVGREWEQELYRNLRSCEAVIVLCSEHSMSSRWVFAEITHARARGKLLFPLKIGPCEIDPVLRSVQVLDLTADRDAALRQLDRALRESGLDPRSVFRWDPARPPYPGLPAFAERDAAVFFGRDAEVQRGRELLRRLRHFGDSQLVLLHGASGTGKSSLLRAGLLPHLRNEPERWLVVRPFRPQPSAFPLTDPFRELALALAAGFPEHDPSREWSLLRDALERAAGAPAAGPSVLEEIAEELRIARGQPEATVVLVLDQLEELFTHTPAPQADRFLALLRATLAKRGSPLLLLATLRSDFLETFHRSVPPELCVEMPVGPLPRDQWTAIIEGPAEKAGLELEPGLVAAMLRDTEREDALPLLAFTLRELWHLGGDDRVLTLREYREGLGGLAGSVARAAEATLAAQPLSEQQLADLRTVFASRMVKMPERGRIVRRAVRRSEVPESVHPVLDRFVDARLLVARRVDDEVPPADGPASAAADPATPQPVPDERRPGNLEWEVAHETLFHSWKLLADWLREDEEFLLWRARLERAAGDWVEHGRDPGALLRGAPLAEAKRWLGPRAAELGERECSFVEASLEAEQAEIQARRQAKRARRRQRITAAAAVAALPLLALLGWRAYAAEQQQHATAILNTASLESDPLVGMLLLSELICQPRWLAALFCPSEPEGGATVARQLADAAQGRVPLEIFRWEDPGLLRSAAFTPAGVRAAIASPEGMVRLWTTEPGARPVVLAGHGSPVLRVAFSPDAERVLTGASDGSIRVWQASTGDSLFAAAGASPVTAVAFAPDGSRVAVGFYDGTVRVWDPGSGSEMQLASPLESVVTGVEFSPDGSLLALSSSSGDARLWSLREESGVAARLPAAGVRSVSFRPVDGPVWLVQALEDGRVRLCRDGLNSCTTHLAHRYPVSSARFSPDGARLLTVADDGSATLWAIRGDSLIPETTFQVPGQSIGWTEFSREGDRVLTVSDDGLVRTWRAEARGDPLALRGHGVAVHALAFAPRDGARVLSAAEDGTARLWDAADGRMLAEPLGHGEPVHSAVFSRDGSRIATATMGGSVRVCGAELTGCRPVLRHQGEIRRVALSSDGSRVAAASDDGQVRVGWSDLSRDALHLGSHSAPVRSVEFSPDGSRLLTASLDSTARVWHLDSPGHAVRLSEHTGEVLHAAFNPRASRVATASRDSTVRIWRIDGQAAVAMPPLRHPARVEHVAFSPDASWVATAAADGVVRLWQAERAGQPRLLGKHHGPVRSVEFSSDGRRVLSTADDDTVRIWSADGHERTILLAGGIGTRTAAFSPDGTRVATAAQDGTVLLWRTDWRGLLEHFRTSTRVCLTRDERQRLLYETERAAEEAFDRCRRLYGRAALHS